MTFISYAQNYEDVMLWRALKHVKNGFYIDVGAGGPIDDSVTKAFYDRGWRGINIEPLKSHHQDLIAARSNDVNLLCAAGSVNGQVDLWECDVRGWATASSDVIYQHEQAGHTGVLHKVPVFPLANICEQHVQGEIHFLKIDVEGLEKEVLQGMNFKKFRPWIVVVEATKPNSTEETHKDWEELIFSHDYVFAYVDGINRFYVSKEQSKNLLTKLRYPPNLFDDFIDVKYLDSETRIQNIEKMARQAEEKARQAEEKARHTETLLNNSSLQLKNVYSSNSWKVTHPCRVLFSFIRFLKIEFYKLIFFLVQKPVIFIGKYLHFFKYLIFKLLFKLGLGELMLGLYRKLSFRYGMMNDTQRINLSPVSNRLRYLYVDITGIVENDLRTGIQRVVRGLMVGMMKSSPFGFEIKPVYSNGRTLKFLHANKFCSELFGHEGNLNDDTEISPEFGDIFLGLDFQVGHILQKEAYLLKLREQGLRVCFVLYDLLPVLYPKWFPDASSIGHDKWLQVITKFDHIFCISNVVKEGLKNWIQKKEITLHNRLEISAFLMGADYLNSASSSGISEEEKFILSKLQNQQVFLMVGTIEPRKGHEQVLSAFEKLWIDDEQLILVVVGKKGWKVDELIRRMEDHHENNHRFFWFKHASDECLSELYSISTCLIAASYAEGFGLPLIEASQHDLPIVARDIPEFREVAGKSAYYFQSNNVADLSLALLEWQSLYKKGMHPNSMGISTVSWELSAKDLLDQIIQKFKYSFSKE